MGQTWDGGDTSFQMGTWQAVYDVLAPGGLLLAFGGTRTWHRLACAIEDAGWDIKDTLMWMYACLSEDTEVLVDGRWVQWHKAMEGCLALCYNLQHGTYEWHPIQKRVVYPYEDIAYRIYGDTTDQLVSRNHRVLIEHGGTYRVCLAEHLPQEQEIRVPVLEDVSGVLAALPVPHPRASTPEQNVFACLSKDPTSSYTYRYQQAAVSTPGQDTHSLCRMRECLLEAESLAQAHQDADVFQALQWSAAYTGCPAACCQRAGALVGRSTCTSQGTDDRGQQSCLERWSDVFPQARQLQADQIRTLSSRVSPHGPEGRLRHGTPAARGTSHGAVPLAARSGPSRERRSTGQPSGEPGTVCQQQRSQAVRASRYTKADLARVTPMHYTGIVWCISVPTGFFVARRNGQVFITGNSGFPKSLDISKAIDRQAGAEREVLGTYRNGSTSLLGLKDDGRSCIIPLRNGEITAPSTPDAQLWQGYGTALTPSYEPILLAQKPLNGTYAQNAVRHGVAGTEYCRGEDSIRQRRRQI